MAAYHAEYLCDLAKPSQVIAVPHVFVRGDNESHTFTALVYDSNNPSCGLMAGSVSGAVVLPDGRTVPLTNGTKGSAVREIVLGDGTRVQATECTITTVQACFDCVGAVRILIRLISGTAMTTVLAARATVQQGLTDTIIDPGTVITDITQLIADAKEAAEEAEQALRDATLVVSYNDQSSEQHTAEQQAQARSNIGAPGYAEIAAQEDTTTASVAHRMGTMLYVDGNLYKAVQPIAAGAQMTDGAINVTSEPSMSSASKSYSAGCYFTNGGHLYITTATVSAGAVLEDGVNCELASPNLQLTTVSSAVSASESREQLEALHDLVNFHPGDEESMTALGVTVTRRKTRLHLNGTITTRNSTPWKLKLNNTLQSATSNTVMARCSDPVELEDGHVYRLHQRHISGTATYGSGGSEALVQPLFVPYNASSSVGTQVVASPEERYAQLVYSAASYPNGVHIVASISRPTTQDAPVYSDWEAEYWLEDVTYGALDLPHAPTTDGTYTLRVTVTDGVPSYGWVSDTPTLGATE